MLNRCARFAEVSAQFGDGRGVRLDLHVHVDAAAVIVRKHCLPELRRIIGTELGIELPRQPRIVSAGETSVIGMAPDAWLVTREMPARAAPSLAGQLRLFLGTLAAVSDHSGAYQILQLTGPEVRNALAKLVAVDLHDEVFQQGHAATTSAGHIGITLVRLPDSQDGNPVFRIMVFGSLADSFLRALQECAAEYGLVCTGFAPQSL